MPLQLRSHAEDNGSTHTKVKTLLSERLTSGKFASNIPLFSEPHITTLNYKRLYDCNSDEATHLK